MMFGHRIEKVNKINGRTRRGTVAREPYIGTAGRLYIDVVWDDMPQRGPVEQPVTPSPPYILNPSS